MTRLFLLFILLFCFLSVSIGQKEWEKVKTSGNITVWIKNHKDSEIKQFKAVTSFKTNLQTVVKILQDVERMHEWYDRVKSVKTLEKISELQAVYMLEYSLPFPFKNRFSTIKGSLTYGTDLKSAIIETGYFPYQTKLLKDKTNLITKIRSQWFLKETDNGYVSVTHEGFMDPGGNIPVWAINQDVAEAPVKTLLALQNKLKEYK